MDLLHAVLPTPSSRFLAFHCSSAVRKPERVLQGTTHPACERAAELENPREERRVNLVCRALPEVWYTVCSVCVCSTRYNKCRQCVYVYINYNNTNNAYVRTYVRTYVCRSPSGVELRGALIRAQRQ